MIRKKTYNSPLFEELEPRLLFSADVAEAFAADAVVEEYVEEPVIVAELDPGQENNDIAVDQPPSEGSGVIVERQIEPSTNNPAGPDFDETLPSEESATDPSGDTVADETTRSLDVSLQYSIEGPGAEPIGAQTGETEIRTELVLINDTVRDKEQLIDDIQQSDTSGQSYEVITLDGKQTA